jgi:hypothetical protein
MAGFDTGYAYGAVSALPPTETPMPKLFRLYEPVPVFRACPSTPHLPLIVFIVSTFQDVLFSYA